jgi:hypothetical protein
MANVTPRFEGEVETRWLVHGGADREMEILREFSFIDSTGYHWVAHPGEKVDGASIPEQVLVYSGGYTVHWRLPARECRS